MTIDPETGEITESPADEREAERKRSGREWIEQCREQLRGEEGADK